MLSINTSMHILNLKGITSKREAVEIAKMSSSNTSLHTLYLYDNNTEYEEIIEIVKMLESNYTSTDVYLGFANTELTEKINRNKFFLKIKDLQKLKWQIFNYSKKWINLLKKLMINMY